MSRHRLVQAGLPTQIWLGIGWHWWAVWRFLQYFKQVEEILVSYCMYMGLMMLGAHKRGWCLWSWLPMKSQNFKNHQVLIKFWQNWSNREIKHALYLQHERITSAECVHNLRPCFLKLRDRIKLTTGICGIKNSWMFFTQNYICFRHITRRGKDPSC
jgi:hypothetical protein